MKVNKEPKFRNIFARRYFERLKSSKHLCEFGQDSMGNLYFRYTYDRWVRYTRRDFIKEAKMMLYSI